MSGNDRESDAHPTATIASSPPKVTTRRVGRGVTESSFGGVSTAGGGRTAGSDPTSSNPLTFTSRSPSPFDVYTHPPGMPPAPAASAPRSNPVDPSGPAHNPPARCHRIDELGEEAEGGTDGEDEKRGRLRVVVGQGTTISFISGHLEYELLCSLGGRRWKLMKRYSAIFEFRQSLIKSGVTPPGDFPKKEYLVPVDLDKRQEKLKVWFEALCTTVDLANNPAAREFFEVAARLRGVESANAEGATIAAVPTSTALYSSAKSPTGALTS